LLHTTQSCRPELGHEISALAVFYIAQVLCPCCLSVEEVPVGSRGTEISCCFDGSSPSEGLDFERFSNVRKSSARPLMATQKDVKRITVHPEKIERVMFA